LTEIYLCRGCSDQEFEGANAYEAAQAAAEGGAAAAAVRRAAGELRGAFSQAAARLRELGGGGGAAAPPPCAAAAPLHRLRAACLARPADRGGLEDPAQVRCVGAPLLIMIRTEDEMERIVGGSQPPLRF
jgi:hypothetical protein